MSNNAIVTVAATAMTSKISKREALETILGQQVKNISKIAASHISATRLVAIAVGAASRNPLLYECEPVTIIRSLLQAAEMGLEVGALNEAYLVPFRNNKRNVYECQLMIDYRGYLKLCWQSKMVASIDAGVVYDQDEFHFRKGTQVEIDYRPNIDADYPERFWPDDRDADVPHRWGHVRCVYAAAQLTTGGTVAIVLTRAQVERFRARSKAANSNFWVNDWEPMAIKTALKRLQNLLPKSTQMSMAVALDNAAEFGDVAMPAFNIPEANYEELPEEGSEELGMEAAKKSLKAKNEAQEAQGALVSE